LLLSLWALTWTNCLIIVYSCVLLSMLYYSIGQRSLIRRNA